MIENTRVCVVDLEATLESLLEDLSRAFRGTLGKSQQPADFGPGGRHVLPGGRAGDSTTLLSFVLHHV